MNRSILIILFIAVCLCQLALTGKWVYDAESVKSFGTFAKIPCVQIDPIDPLRGSYLLIHPIPNQIYFEDSSQYSPKDEVWINYKLTREEDVYEYHSAQPLHEVPTEAVYVKAMIQYIYPSDASLVHHHQFTATIEYPFSKYFINEKLAPSIAEKYNRALTDTSTKVFCGVFIKNGTVLLDGLWIGKEKL